MPSLTLEIKHGGDLARRILSGCRDRIKASQREYQRRHNKWRLDEEAALAYLPEKDIDAVRRANRENAGKPQYTTIQIPYTYAVLMSMHTYWTSVFMARDPVLQYTARHGEGMQSVQAVEALMSYQRLVGNMLVPWYIWLMDAGKYGAGIIGVYWDEQYANVSKIEEQEELYLGTIKTGKMKRVKVSRRIKGYQGNKVYNVRPYDFFPDPHVPFHRFQEGEFCGTYTEMPRNRVLEREALGYYTNLEHIGMRSAGSGTSGVPAPTERQEGSSQLELPSSQTYNFEGDDRDAEGKKKTLPEVVKLYEVCIAIIPEKWGLGASTLPEKWMFTCTADFTVVIGAQPLGANHDKFPFVVLELEPEGYGLANRGVPEILQPVQQTVDWLINSHFYNVRKVLNNQFLVDPSRVVMKDAENSMAGGFIRLKPAAYGTDIRTAMMQLPVMDVTQTNLRDMEVMLGFGQRTLGVNDQIMGMLQTGGRKTAQEIRTSSTFGVNRLKTNCEYFSAMGWEPMSQMLLQNAQQYYDDALKLKIVGDVAGTAGQNWLDVTPDNIAGFYDFVPVDGTLPVDRFAQANMWRELFAGMRQMPDIMMQYDMGRIFEWVAQLAGLKNISQFKLQVTDDAKLMAQVQAGNVVPLGGRGPKSGPGGGRVPAGQIPGMGTTG